MAWSRLFRDDGSSFRRVSSIWLALQLFGQRCEKTRTNGYETAQFVNIQVTAVSHRYAEPALGELLVYRPLTSDTTITQRAAENELSADVRVISRRVAPGSGAA